LFGAAATSALMDELSAAGVHLESATVAQVQRGEQLHLILHQRPLCLVRRVLTEHLRWAQCSVALSCGAVLAGEAMLPLAGAGRPRR
jgi:hypothetical protein